MLIIKYEFSNLNKILISFIFFLLMVYHLLSFLGSDGGDEVEAASLSFVKPKKQRAKLLRGVFFHLSLIRALYSLEGVEPHIKL